MMFVVFFNNMESIPKKEDILFKANILPVVVW